MGLQMLNMSVKQYVESLNNNNLYLLYFTKDNPRQLDQDEIIKNWIKPIL
jgi:hypothetical protein